MITPDLAPGGTVAVIVVAVSVTIGNCLRPMMTAVADPRPVPLMVMTLPTLPVGGEKEEITGAETTA